MADRKILHSWILKLRAANDLNQAADILTGGLLSVFSYNAAVFLLDISVENLVLYGSNRTENDHDFITVSLKNIDDPLPLCLIEKRDVWMNIEGFRPPASVNILINETGRTVVNVIAKPLIGPQNSLVGALIIEGGKEETNIASLSFFCDYGAIILSSLIEAKRYSSRHRMMADELTRMVQKHESQSHDNLGLIGHSKIMIEIKRMILRAAEGQTTVLLTGETGTGKGLAATAIHKNSPRRDQPFIEVNCAAIPANLLESEFFGHNQGAFTGAVKNRLGLFREANGGTLFLDEIGEMPIDLQAKLLQVLQDRKVRPLGSSTHYDLDVMVLAATNSDLKSAVKDGRFRRDLYHRLAVFPIELPRLDEHREDIIPLIDHFLDFFAVQYKRPELSMTDEAKSYLSTVNFQGNVRELRSVVERAVLMLPCGLDIIDHEMLKPKRLALKKKIKLAQLMADFEYTVICKTLAEYGGNVIKTARHLGLPKRTLYHKMKKLGYKSWN